MESNSKKRRKVKKSTKKNKSNNIIMKTLSEYIKLYKENLRKKHIIIYIICMIILFLLLVNGISNISSTPDIAKLAENSQNVISQNKGFFEVIKTDIIVMFLIILAGITPYFYIPVVGVVSSVTFAIDIANKFSVMNSSGNVVFMCIGAIIQLFAISLAIATGMYYCSISTKRWRYTNSKGYTMLDMKKMFYQGLKKEKELEQVKQKLDKRAVENEKLNVKVPYKMLMTSLIICIIISIVGSLIYII